MPINATKAAYRSASEKVRKVANLPPRRADPGDVPLGTGMAGKAKTAIQSRQSRIDKALKDAGG